MSAPMVAPDYEDRSIVNVVRALRGEGSALADLQSAICGASSVVLVLLDGLGDHQLSDRAALAPTMARARLDAVTSVAPSTTAAALTSLTTGVPPGLHGIVGYKMAFGPDILQTLGWRVAGSDAAQFLPPLHVQQYEPLLHDVQYFGRTQFETSAFTAAHLRGVKYRGIDDLSAVPADVSTAASSGPLTVWYHDAIDKVAHAAGLGDLYEQEVHRADDAIAALRSRLGDETAIVVTSDHGQVDVGDARVAVPTHILDRVVQMSGEGRFRWLHVTDGSGEWVAAELAEHLRDECWVLTRTDVVERGLLGPVAPGILERLGDVAVIPFAGVYVHDPLEPHEHRMKSRHGSLTSAEMLVPLCVL